MFFNNLCKPQDGAMALRMWSQTAQRAVSQPVDLPVGMPQTPVELPTHPDLINYPVRLPQPDTGISIIL